jgi:hypothetical protein
MPSLLFSLLSSCLLSPLITVIIVLHRSVRVSYCFVFFACSEGYCHVPLLQSSILFSFFFSFFVGNLHSTSNASSLLHRTFISECWTNYKVKCSLWSLTLSSLIKVASYSMLCPWSRLNFNFNLNHRHYCHVTQFKHVFPTFTAFWLKNNLKNNQKMVPHTYETCLSEPHIHTMRVLVLT